MHSESNLPSSSKNSGDAPVPNPAAIAPPEVHAATILERWSVTAHELTTLVNDNPSLRGILLGYVAEHKFQQLIERHPHISGSKKYDDHDRTRKSDRVIVYKGVEFSVEVKSL